VVLVHSSLSGIGYVPGGVETLIDALLQSVGEEGTIVVPTITGQIFDSPDTPRVSLEISLVGQECS